MQELSFEGEATERGRWPLRRDGETLKGQLWRGSTRQLQGVFLGKGGGSSEDPTNSRSWIMGQSVTACSFGWYYTWGNQKETNTHLGNGPISI